MMQKSFELDRAGLMLRGMTYQPVPEKRQATVVFLHGFTGHRMENGFFFVHLARTLATHGIASITFDFMHSGESDGTFDQMLVTGQIEDALHITEWAQRQPFVDRSRLGLLGFSLGGVVASCVMGRSDAYHALCMLAPSSVQNMCRFSGDHDTCPDSRPYVGPHELHPRFFDDLQTLDPHTEITRRPVPTLLAHGTGDATVPPETSARYEQALQAAGGQTERLLINGADHGFAKPPWRAQLMPAVARFFADAL